MKKTPSIESARAAVVDCVQMHMAPPAIVEDSASSALSSALDALQEAIEADFNTPADVSADEPSAADVSAESEVVVEDLTTREI